MTPTPARATRGPRHRGVPRSRTGPGSAAWRPRRSRVAGLLRFAVFLLLIFVAVWAGVRVANATADSETFDGRVYEVRAGDTLWQIAVDQYDDTLDVREIVHEIRVANGLDDAVLQPGQRLSLPYLDE